MNRAVLATRVGAVLLLLLGLARGFGGAILLLRGRAAFADSLAGDRAMRFMGTGLLLVAILGCAASVLLYRLSRPGFFLATTALFAFIIGGLINGTLLFGRPTAAGTTVNLAASAVILALLSVGRAALLHSAPPGIPTSPPASPAA